jgi:hypothetical protein
MGEYFWKNHALKAARNKILGQMIFNQSLKKFSNIHNTKYAEIRFLHSNFEPLTEIIIQNDNIANIIWTRDPVLFMLQDKYAASAYKRYFDILWKNALKK